MRDKISIYEMADIIERVSIATLGGKKAHDYGTGDKYTSLEVHTVEYIADHPGCTVTEIATSWRKTTSAVSQMIKKLKQAKIVMVKTDARDEKVSHLYLTSKGEELDQAHKVFDSYAWGKTIEGLRQKYSEEEINTCFWVLKDWLKASGVSSSYDSLLEGVKSIKE